MVLQLVVNGVLDLLRRFNRQSEWRRKWGRGRIITGSTCATSSRSGTASELEPGSRARSSSGSPSPSELSDSSL
jgi:hypothetical protein